MTRTAIDIAAVGLRAFEIIAEGFLPIAASHTVARMADFNDDMMLEICIECADEDAVQSLEHYQTNPYPEDFTAFGCTWLIGDGDDTGAVTIDGTKATIWLRSFDD